MSDRPSDGDGFASARTNIRDTIKWLIGAFAGVAAVIVGTTPLTNIGSLKDFPLLLAVATGAIAIVCVLYAINVALKILVTPIFFLSDIVSDSALCKIINEHCRDVLPPGFTSVQNFFENRTMTQNTLYKLVSTPHDPNEPNDATAKRNAEIDVLRSNLTATITVSSRLLGLAHFERLRRDFDGSRKVLFLLAISAFFSLIIFSWATKQAKPDATAAPLHVILDHGADKSGNSM